MTAGDDFQLFLADGLESLKRQDRFRERRVIDPISSTECRINGRRGIQFATNDYLALACHPAVRQALCDGGALQVGARASALVCGRMSVHAELEQRLAEFEGTEAALLFPSGFSANVGTLTSLIRTQDAVFCDRDNHASLIDGCRQSAGKMFVYRYRELEQLETALQKRRRDFERVYLVTDTVFSMDGTLAPLKSLCSLAEHYQCQVVVDEAHATGLYGDRGSGVCEMLDVKDRVAVRIGTLSKALGAIGGFTSGSRQLVDWLWNTARPQFFSTALPPAICRSVLESLKVVVNEPERRQDVFRLSEFARQTLQELGLETIPDGVGPIIPILLGDDRRAVSVSARLLESGFFIPAIRPPTVAEGTARLRMSLCCEHSPEQIHDALSLVRKILDA